LSLNRYAYVQGNPINLTDASGMCVDARVCAQLISQRHVSLDLLESMGCLEGSPVQSGNTFTYTYARGAAALKAIDMATTKSLGYPFAESGTDSARFMSIALHAGGLPLTTTDKDGKTNFCETSPNVAASRVGWCVKNVGSLLEANTVFKNHNIETATTGLSYNPTANHGLIGYLLGNPDVLGSGIVLNSSKTYLAVADGDVFGPPLGGGRTYDPHQDISSSDMQTKYAYLKAHIDQISLGSFCVGDYVWFAGGYLMAP